MNLATHGRRLKAFRALHKRGRPLALPTAWDPASARIFEQVGFSAIDTSSSAVAGSLGYPDGARLPRDLLFRAIERMVGSVRIPVTVDLESDARDTVTDTAETVHALVALGVVGITLHDGGAEPSWLEEQVAEVRRLPVFINARTSVYLRPAADAEARFNAASRRLDLYTDAGADGVSVAGIADLEEIGDLAWAARRPLNVRAESGVPPIQALAEVGVASVSMGCGPMQSAFALLRRAAAKLLRSGTYDASTDNAAYRRDVKQSFSAHRRATLHPFDANREPNRATRRSSRSGIA